MSNENNLSEIYPNSPLIKVACEVRFALNFDIFSGYQKYYEQIKGEFGEVQVPPASPVESPYRQPVIFRNPETEQMILLAADRFSYVEDRYQDHESFFKRFLIHVTRLCKTYNVSSYNRLGLRYVNLISFSRVGNRIPIGDFLSTSFTIGESLDDKIVDLNVAFTRKENEHSLQVRLGSGRDAFDKEGLILDFDYFIDKEVKFNGLETHLENGNKRIKGLFEKCITDSYRSYLKGESL